MTSKEKWNDRFRDASLTLPQAAAVVREFAHLLPVSGTALDYACGRGGNAMFLAQTKLAVSAWDFSSAALRQLEEMAAQQKLCIQTRQVNLETDDFAFASCFDVIVVSHYLYRPKFAEIINGLNSGGLLFYQTFTRKKVSTQGPNNPDYLLQPNELIHLAAGLQIVAYREEGALGNIEHGLRNQAYLVARKE